MRWVPEYQTVTVVVVLGRARPSLRYPWLAQGSQPQLLFVVNCEVAWLASTHTGMPQCEGSAQPNIRSDGNVWECYKS